MDRIVDIYILDIYYYLYYLLSIVYISTYWYLIFYQHAILIYNIPYRILSIL